VVVALLATISAVFYFAGSQYLDTLARTFGFAGDIGEGGLQKTMAVGADVIFNRRFFPYYVAVLIIALLFISALDFLSASNRILGKLTEYSNRLQALKIKFDALKVRRRSSHDGSRIEQALIMVQMLSFFPRLRRLALGVAMLKLLVSARTVREALLAALLTCAALSSIWLILIAGELEARRQATEIANDLRADCSRCRLYSVEGASAVGIPVRQTSAGIIIAERTGAAFLPTGSGLRISELPKKAGRLAGGSPR